jgi:dipeptidyl aminopeptidase/acylaminoacyl peptidase
VAYASREADREDVYVTTFPEPTSRWLISKDGGDEPFWHPDGTELIYRSNDNVLVAVEVETETQTFRVGKATSLFQIDPQPSNGTKWHITPDGERFLVNTDLSPSQSDPITVVTDWRLDTGKQ